jgi:hypothetical protein
MAKKKSPKIIKDTPYRSALCGLGNAVSTANEWEAEGYEVKWCFAVVASDSEGKPTQAIYMLGYKVNAVQ